MKKSYLFCRSTRCTGCRLCEMACALTHDNICGPGRSVICVVTHPDLGTAMPYLIDSCFRPTCGAPCVQVCTPEAIKRVSEDEVARYLRDPEWEPVPVIAQSA